VLVVLTAFLISADLARADFDSDMEKMRNIVKEKTGGYVECRTTIANVGGKMVESGGCPSDAPDSLVKQHRQDVDKKRAAAQIPAGSASVVVSGAGKE
jgi:hypothetical protein